MLFLHLPVPVASGLRCRSADARLLRMWVPIPPGAWIFVCCECCVLSGRGFCDGLITRPEESYQLWCVVVCDLETSSSKRRPWPELGCSAIGKKIHLCVTLYYLEIILTTSVSHYILLTYEPHSLLHHSGVIFLFLHLTFYLLVSKIPILNLMYMSVICLCSVIVSLFISLVNNRIYYFIL